MSNLLDKTLALKLNKHWIAFEQLTVRDAITMLCPRDKHDNPGYALDFITVYENGEPVIQYANPISWDEWIKLPIREGDLSIETSRGAIRVPLVIICANYDKIPLVTPKLSNEAILKRDGYTCQYTNEKLPKSQINIDHIISKDRGGKDTWENMVACNKEINFKKGNKTNKEAGLKLIRKPVAPKASVKVIKVDDLPIETRQQVAPFVIKND